MILAAASSRKAGLLSGVRIRRIPNWAAIARGGQMLCTSAMYTLSQLPASEL
jgi:hypothetical protein